MTNNQSEDIAAIAAGLMDVEPEDIRAAASYLSACPFGSSKEDIIRFWIMRASEPDGYVHPLPMLFSRHRTEALRAHLNKTDGEKG